MNNEFTLPKQGFVFGPVGCGDSTTIVVNDETVMQIDLRHMSKADDEKEPAIGVIDELVREKVYERVFVSSRISLGGN